jgi:hypothetical protein
VLQIFYHITYAASIFFLSTEDSPSTYMAVNNLTDLLGVQPYFPKAFALSPDEPLQFNFGLRVLDRLELPCPIRGEGGPVRFGDAEQAIEYLRDEVAAWCQEQTPVPQQAGSGASLSKRQLFLEQGQPLAGNLRAGVPALDTHLDNVRLDG